MAEIRPASSVESIVGRIRRQASGGQPQAHHHKNQPDQHEGSGEKSRARLRILKTLGAEEGPELTMYLASATGEASRVRARYVREHPNGVVVELTTTLGPGVVVRLEGEIPAGDGAGDEVRTITGPFQVATAEVKGIAKYHVHLNERSGSGFASDAKADADGETSSAKQAKGEREANTDAEAPADYYEVLQVSRAADSDTITRVFHLLAQRYHPDNRETGDENHFRMLVEAHRTLIDPEKRAAHNVFLEKENKARIRLFDSLESTQGVQAEIRKREGILRLLYTRRMTDPHQPHMNARDFVAMLEVPAEHLEFSLWFLRSRSLVKRADNNSFEITWEGVLAFEEMQSDYSKKAPLTLPAPAKVAM